jgi:hypothetical protein
VAASNVYQASMFSLLGNLRHLRIFFFGITFYLLSVLIHSGVRGSVVVKALCYKPEGRGFDSR